MVGREAIKDGEIVIEKETANQMWISNPLNKNINLMIMNKYVDDNEGNKIDSDNKTFKIVGILEKPDRYYSSLSNSISGIKTQAFVYKEANFQIKTKDTYKGTIFLLLSKDKISKAYQDELNIKNILYQEEHNNEYPLLIRGYSDEILKSREPFIEEGENLINAKEGKYKKVTLVNNKNSQVTHSFDAKVGDVIDIKLPVYRDGIKKYETFKVEVSAIMKEVYAASQDGNIDANGAQVIFREDNYKELTGQKDYNKIYQVEKRLERLTKDYAFSSIGGKGEDMKFIKSCNI